MRKSVAKYVVASIVLGLSIQQPIKAYTLPDTIRIGLESIAKDTYTLTIRSEADLTIGYFDSERWYEEATLPTDTVTVEIADDTYYMYGESFDNYEDAKDALEDYEDAVVAYIQPEEYRIYITDEERHTEQVDNNSARIAIYDADDTLLLVSENNRKPLGFQGSYDAYDFPATGIGSERLYRGVIEVVKGQYRGVTAVSVLPFEEYLYGVINNEMGYTNPQEALKAQAVASRSMAAYQRGRFQARGYDLVDTTSTQVYRGITSERDQTTKAVDATAGQVAVYNGQIAETVYCASGGGHTENVQYVWGSKVPYLTGVKDPYETNQHDWTRTITLDEIENCLKGDGVDIGRVTGVKIEGWTASGRVERLTILGSTGEHALTREQPRTFFHDAKGGSLKSTMFKFTPYEDASRTVVRTALASKAIGEEAYFILSGAAASFTTLESMYVESETNKERLEEGRTLYAVTAKGTEVIVEQAEEDDATQKPELEQPDNEAPFDPSGEPTVMYGDITLYGKGYGHGVGMSQNGAIAMAQQGFDYKDIMTFYFNGITIE